MSTDTHPIFSSQALTVLRERYLQKDPRTGAVIETPAQFVRRVAHGIAQAERRYGADEARVQAIAEEFERLMANVKFLPNTPTLINAGRANGYRQYSACFVIPVEDDMGSIADAIKAAMLIWQSGGGTGFAFSRLRPKGDRVRSSGGVASGPVSFMKIIDTAAEQVAQGGTRRAANMAILTCDHPDILEFIRCKATDGQIRNFNLSVGVTDAFMQAVQADAEWALINPRTRQAVRTLKARAIWDVLVEHAWTNGEPGLFFLDRVNADNPIPHLGRIEACNPCGEKPLHPYDACTLGHVNLERHLLRHPETGRVELDWTELTKTIRLGVRFLDDVVEANDHPLSEINAMTRTTRQIGLGIMGLARVLFAKELAYDSEGALQETERIMARFRELAWQASAELAAERGVYPGWPGGRHEAEGRKVRNSYVTTIAPTGTTAMLADTSYGIEPEVSLLWFKRVLDGKELPYVCEPFERTARRDGWWTDDLMARITANHGSCRGLVQVPERWQRVFATAHDIAPEWHVRMQAAVQRHIDSGVSKTINLPRGATVEDVATAYRLAWELGCKGITVYRDGSRKDQVLNVGHARPADPAAGGNGSLAGNGRPTPDGPAPAATRVTLPAILESKRILVNSPDGPIYVHIGLHEGRPIELFITTPEEAKHEEVYEVLARWGSVALQYGAPLAKLLKHADGANRKYGSVATIPAALVRAFRMIEREGRPDAACPKCTGTVIDAEGCLKCLTCDWSRCE